MGSDEILSGNVLAAAESRITPEQAAAAARYVRRHARGEDTARLLDMLGLGGVAASLDSPATPSPEQPPGRPDPHRAPLVEPRASGGRGHRALPGPTRPATEYEKHWRDRALCRDEDPELFFPVGNSGPALLQIAEAKTVCRRCPVADLCRADALENGLDHGVFGNLSEDERRKLKRRNARTTARTTEVAS